MQHHRIVIAGAGPAGTSTSLFLAKAGIPHLIIDKATFPRDKVCGDALSGKVVEVMKKLDASMIDEMSATSQKFMGSYGVVFGAPNGKELSIPFRSIKNTDTTAPGFISKRVDFDDYLFRQLNRTYAEVKENATLEKVQRTGTQLHLDIHYNGTNETISCDILIDAQGDRSVCNKQLAGIKKEDAHYCAGIRAYYKNVTGFNEGNFIELHFLEELLPGYFWIFPLPNGMANVGAGMLSKTVSHKKINLREAMLKAIKENPRIKERFKDAELVGKIQGWGLPLGSKKRNISGDNFLLTGDAGSLIDPFTGEGIGNALYSGMLAAAMCEKAIQHNRFDAAFLKEYDHNIYDRLWDELQLSHTLQKLCKYPSLFNFVVNKAHKSKTLRETISCMFDDIDMRSQFSNPLFYLKMLLNK
jgi:geranylgeranyl reductase family protein